MSERRTFALRRATNDDADAIAELYYDSFRSLSFLPMLHAPAGYRRYVADRMLRECEVTLAEDDTGIVSFMSRHG